jgi:outer membrane protein assembly factor BamB
MALRTNRWHVLLTAAVLLVGAAAAQDRTDQSFCFFHISDIHVDPDLARIDGSPPLRSAPTLAWICDEAARPQELPALELKTPPPAFVIATGDLTEYGAIDQTWQLFERAFEKLPCPLYVIPGNHDNTWVPVYHIMRRRHGGANYSFERFGWHFVMLCSASPHEPLPTLDATARSFLHRDLADVPPGTPIVVALHHPPWSDEFANPAEYDTFIDELRDHNVVLLLYGHGHNAAWRNLDGIDGIMGGSTFGQSAGYAVVSVLNGRLCVAYRYHRKPTTAPTAAPAAQWQALLDKPVQRTVPPRIFRRLTLQPANWTGKGPAELSIEFCGDAQPPPDLQISVQLDGQEVPVHRLPGTVPPAWSVEPRELVSGWHLLSVRGSTESTTDLRTLTFVAGNPPWLWRRQFTASVRAAPVVADHYLIVACTDGLVTALDRSTGSTTWSFQAGAEIISTPACSNGLIVFGGGDGRVYALSEQGSTAWTFDAQLPVYGSPAIADSVVYIGDSGGRLHALNLADGRPRWRFERADFAIESAPCIWNDLVIFGAWDGNLYALRASDGTLVWKAPGPKSSAGGGTARYYAPADCPPVALDRRLFVCDRGYLLASFDVDGRLGQTIAEGVCAITADTRASARRTLVARYVKDRVSAFDATGHLLWETAVPTGRFPLPPTCTADSVILCSNRGRLSVLRSSDGAVTWSVQTTPGFYVMAPVAVDESGMCYVAGMDGSVTAFRPTR